MHWGCLAGGREERGEGDRGGREGGGGRREMGERRWREGREMKRGERGREGGESEAFNYKNAKYSLLPPPLHIGIAL